MDGRGGRALSEPQSTVEVLNEPLNAPPPYREALGGSGTTGFDWVIKSFELARKHFPKAKLILNEFNVIIEDGLTTNYLNYHQPAEGAQAHRRNRRAGALPTSVPIPM